MDGGDDSAINTSTNIDDEHIMNGNNEKDDVGGDCAAGDTEMIDVNDLSSALDTLSLDTRPPPGASMVRDAKLKIADTLDLQQLHALCEELAWHPFGIAIKDDGRVSKVTGRQIRFGQNEYEDITISLSMPGAYGFDSPLLTLQHHVDVVLKHGEALSKDVLNQLHLAAREGWVRISKPGTKRFGIDWRRCQVASSLIMLLACSKEKLKPAVKDQSTSLGGVPTLAQIQRNSSADIVGAYRAAKQAAKQGKKMTVMAVTFADVTHRELLEKKIVTPYPSSDHSFVLGIGLEGVIMWQANGYTLDQYIGQGGARVRSWDEAGQIVDKVSKLAQYKGDWDESRYRFYRECFEIDLAAYHDGNVPKLDAWLRILVLEDIKLEHLYKFKFE